MSDLLHYDAAEKWLDSRVRMMTGHNSAEISALVPAQIRAHCFFSARVAEEAILKPLQELSDAHARGEMTLAEARLQLKTFLGGAGYDTTSKRLSALASTARLNLILRQNQAMAQAVGQYQRGRDPDIEAYYPNWRYVAMPGARDSHAELNGKVFAKSDPIWHSIFPPRDFNCRCTVEDCTDEEAEESGGVIWGMSAPPAASSGYHFDPADAFGSWDLSRISDPDLRVAARDGVEMALGDRVRYDGLTLRVDPDKPRYDTWQDKGLPDVGTWRMSASPDEISAADGERRLDAGVEITTPDGSRVRLDGEVLTHWMDDSGKSSKAIDSLKRKYPYAVETLREPNERWDQETQRRYLKVFRKKSGGLEGCMVVVTNDGRARTYFLPSINQINTNRNGISVEEYK